ncbi:PREDICTED: myomegalin-like [Thamnophis sirtalis]|uniref:Myomegalin-like n=1 Tax=Thamnophis sirtalis TaxID=35019 RepID=A0A6I9YBA3_9SAUR|nr:PREDICTED: myomegalin-like [Thamnophis sirtalis]
MGSEEPHNIELKVEVESLKQELQEKQQSLEKAWTEAENQSNKDEAEICRLPKNKHVYETLGKKIQALHEEVQSAKTKAEKMATLAEVEKKHSLELNKQLMDLSKKQDEIKKSQTLLIAKKDKKINELIKNMKGKEQLLELQSTKKLNLSLEKPEQTKVQEVSTENIPELITDCEQAMIDCRVVFTLGHK